MGDDIGSGILIAILIGIVVFLVFREIYCWYGKINKRVDLLEKQNELLEKLSGQLKANATSSMDNQEVKSSDSAHATDKNYSDEDDEISRDNLFK
jgi:uncharacterized membrane protein YraQ (UPF0718 family)